MISNLQRTVGRVKLLGTIRPIEEAGMSGHNDIFVIAYKFFFMGYLMMLSVSRLNDGIIGELERI
jgi:hypothetical protein